MRFASDYALEFMQHAREGLRIRTQRQARRLALRCAAWAGRYEPLPASALKFRRAEPVAFHGDLPSSAGAEMNQYRLVYEQPREPVLWVDDLVYTARGQAWMGSRVSRRHSFQDPSVRDLLQGAPRPALLLESATLLQCEYPYTYGDWVTEGLMALAGVEPSGMPLLLPEATARKPYVQADVRRLGFELVPVTDTVRVRRARVLQKTFPLINLPVQSIQRFRRRLAIDPPAPRAGSTLYLSRAGEKSESFDRSMPHELIEPVMQRLGVRIVHCRDWRYDDYAQLASEAETVVADLGSATFNLVQWNSKRLIQLYSDAWWDGWGLFVAQGVGIEDIAMLCVDGVDASTLEARLRQLMLLPSA